MVDPITGIDLEKAGVADVVNRQNVGASQRARNELIRQQTQSGQSPDLSSLYSTQQQSQNNSGIMPFDTWKDSLVQYDKPLPRTFNITKGAYSPQEYEYEYAQDPTVDNYLRYAMPGEATLGRTGYYGVDVFGRPNHTQPQDAWRNRTDLPQQVIDALYAPGDEIRHRNDPFVQQLNSKYKYFSGGYGGVQPDSLEAAVNGSGPYGEYGGWDLGNYLALVPKTQHQYQTDRDASTATLLDRSTNFGRYDGKIQRHPDPYTVEGMFNPEGWHVVSTKSNALGGVMGTLGVLAAAAGPAMFGPAGGTAGSLGSENMFFGGLNAVAPTATQSAGMFGNKAWDLGNKYANKAAEGALKGFLFSGGNPTAALQGGLVGPVGGYISDAASPYIGNIASKALGGATSGSLASLFTKNSPIAGSLYGGMSGGLSAYLNSVNANSDPFNKTVSNTLSGLVRKKLFRNK